MNVLELTMSKRKAKLIAEENIQSNIILDKTTNWPYEIVINNKEIGLKQYNSISSILLQNNVNDTIYKGDSVKFSVSIFTEHGDNITDKTDMLFESSNLSVATIDSNGLVNIINKGKSNITVKATYRGKTISENYMLNAELTDSQAVEETIEKLNINGDITCITENIVLTTEDALNDCEITWKSDNPLVIKIMGEDEVNQEIVTMALSNLNISGDLTNVTEDLELVSSQNGCEVIWNSSDSDVIEITDEVITSSFGS